MQSLGGKSRLAKKFASVLLDALNENSGARSIEPFIGGYNVRPARRNDMPTFPCRTE